MSAAQRHIDAFLEMLGAERGAAANTIEAYRRDLERRSGRSWTARDVELIAAEPAHVSGWLAACLGCRPQRRLRARAASQPSASSTSSCSPKASSMPIRRTATPARASGAPCPRR